MVKMFNSNSKLEMTKFLLMGDVSSVVTKERLNVNTGAQFYKCCGPLNGLLAPYWPVVTLLAADWWSSEAVPSIHDSHLSHAAQDTGTGLSLHLHS